MARTIQDIKLTNGTAVLLSYEDGQRALWIDDEYYKHGADEPGTVYTINDINTGVALDPDEDIDEVIDLWKTNVDWED